MVTDPWLAQEFGAPADSTLDAHAPPVICVHWQLPFANASWSGSPQRGGHTPAFADACVEIEEAEPAAQLLHRWLATAATCFETRSLFKAIMKIRNLDELGLGYLQGYNGKPVLVKKSGRIMQQTLPSGRAVLEMRCDVHGWGFVSKRGLVAVAPRLKDRGSSSRGERRTIRCQRVSWARRASPISIRSGACS